MITTMTTKNGNISMDTEVIANYAGSAAVECFGVVGMASISMKDGLVRLLKGDNLTHGVGVKMHDGKIIIDFHIIPFLFFCLFAFYAHSTSYSSNEYGNDNSNDGYDDCVSE